MIRNAAALAVLIAGAAPCLADQTSPVDLVTAGPAAENRLTEDQVAEDQLAEDGVAQVQAANVPEPDDYRGEPYRAPVPATLAGAQVIDAVGAIALHRAGQAVFLDILPRTARPEGLPEGTPWREPPHLSIPGAVWLWNTGYKRLAPDEDSRLRDGIEDARRRDPAAPLVFFCRAECWMSWNAARRAVEWGHEGVFWFPDGTEGWLAAGGAPLVPVAP